MHKSTFVGRERELGILKSEYFQATLNDGNSTRAVVLLAEPGLGKTRIVQEFFGWLSTFHDGVGGEGYWPDELDAVGNNLLVSVAAQSCNGDYPLPFLWWGVRVPESGNIGGISTSVLGAAVNELKPHLEVSMRLRRARQRAAAGRQTVIQATVDVAIEVAESLSGFGIVKTVGKAAMDLGRLGLEHLNDPLDASMPELAARQQRDLAASLVEDLREILSPTDPGRSGVPGVLVIDDGQFSLTDPGVSHFTRLLLKTAAEEKWPLLLVVTHWEREWWSQSKAEGATTLARVLCEWGAEHPVELVEVEPIPDMGRLLRGELPGLTEAQSQGILERAGGNPRYLVEIIALAKENPQFFVGRNRDGQLSDTGQQDLMGQTVSLFNTIRTRLAASPAAVRHALSLASMQGTEFARVLVEGVAGAMGLDDLSAGIAEAELPHAFVRGAFDPTTSFVQGIYREVAAKALPTLLDPVEARNTLINVVREMLQDPQAHGRLQQGQRSLLRKLAVDLMGESNTLADIRLACSSLAREVAWLTSVGDIWGASSTARRYMDLARSLPDDELVLDEIANIDEALSRGFEHRTAIEAMDRRIAVQLREAASLMPVEAIALSNRMAFRARRTVESGDDPRLALPHVDKGLKLLRQAKERASDWPRNGDMFLAVLIGDRASMRSSAGDGRGALEDFAEAIALAESIKSRADWNDQEQHFLANLFSNRGAVQEDLATAETDFSHAIELRQEVMQNGARVGADHIVWLSNGHHGRANRRQRQGNLQGAHADLQEAIRLRKLLLSHKEMPILPEHQLGTAEFVKSLAEFYNKVGDRTAALVTFGEVTRLIQPLAAEAHSLEDPTFALQLVSFIRGMAGSKRNAALYKPAADDLAYAAQQVREIKQRDPAHWNNDREDDFAGLLHDLANAQADLGDLQSALESMKMAEEMRVSLRASLGESYPDRYQRNLVRTKSGLAWRLAYSGMRREALLLYDDCLQLLDGLSPAYFSSINEVKEIEVARLLGEKARWLNLIGDFQSACQNSALAAAKLEALPIESLDDAELLREAYSNAADIHHATDHEKSLDYCNRAFAIWSFIQEKAPTSYWTPAKISQVGSLHTIRGNTLYRLGRLDEAIADHNAQIGYSEQIVKAVPDRVDWVSMLANGYHNRAISLAKKGDLSTAAEGYRSAIALRIEARSKKPEAWSAGQQEGLGNSLQALWSALKVSDPKSAFEALEQAIVERSQHLEMLQDNASPSLVKHLGDDYLEAGRVLQEVGAYAVAINHYSRCIALRERARKGYGTDWSDAWESQLAGAYLSRGQCHLLINDLASAASDGDVAIKLREAIAGRGTSSGISDFKRFLANCYVLRAEAARKDDDARERDLRRALFLFTERSTDDRTGWTEKHARERAAVHGSLIRLLTKRLRLRSLVSHLMGSAAQDYLEDEAYLRNRPRAKRRPLLRRPGE